MFIALLHLLADGFPSGVEKHEHDQKLAGVCGRMNKADVGLSGYE